MATKIDYAAVLADLEDRKGYLNDAIQAIKHLQLAQGAEEPKFATEPAKRGRPARSRSTEPVITLTAKGPKPGDLDYPDSPNTSEGAK
jgi:hypothetical protein